MTIFHDVQICCLAAIAIRGGMKRFLLGVGILCVYTGISTASMSSNGKRPVNGPHILRHIRSDSVCIPDTWSCIIRVCFQMDAV